METSSSLLTPKVITELVKIRQKQAINISREEASKLIPEFNASVQVAIESLPLDEASTIFDEREIRIKVPLSNSFLQKICIPQYQPNQLGPEDYIFHHLTELNSVGQELFNMLDEAGYTPESGHEIILGNEHITIVLPVKK
jgi:hypothetical protein